ncbi:NAD(P)/FAD-dependent oxidoreductase [Roseateles violae]|uniref:FAD-dependent oxidoreductase n=1 Tax=Roseateles violae TaxID=3058042 RepID=A0ABT8DPK1_9BURK|nr:FAD-dependent oxidoreductase [Pelomonas sp. PFR6]MDN3920092.1 FAD-dependent oxidoreductase [Pelomonas sp. PFR6]
MRRVAIVGSGIAGLAAAHRLASAADGHRVTLFEAGDHFGGHANTVDLEVDGVVHGVDTGFLVFNKRTYPLLMQLFAELGIAPAESDMSFSVQLPAADGSPGLEWSGSSLRGVFAQRRNLLRPRFWHMLSEILRFNRLATALAQGDVELMGQASIGDFLDQQGFEAGFREHYLLPMIGCIWSCPTDQMLRFPLSTLVRFCHNHGLIQVTDRPQWYTVRGGSREYVRRMVARIGDARLRSPVLGLQRSGQQIRLRTAQGTETFEAVVLACHSDQALRLLGEGASAEERAVLGAIRYQPNTAVLHGDVAVLPRRRAAWASWNYERASQTNAEQAQVCLHYLINRLQPLPWQQPVIVSLNPARPIAEHLVHRRIDYSHPVFDLAALQAQRRLGELQGRQGTWFCGAWCGYGFHEDGLRAGLQAAEGVLQALGSQPEQERSAA